jgi:three-Cys-motif partner protein
MTIPTVWQLDPHTQAKHQILEEYLKAWFPILSKYNKRIMYIDGFSGPGIYKKGESGSPIIALQCLVDHSHNLCSERPNREFVFLFIEEDEERVKILSDRIEKKFPNLPQNIKIQLENGEFDTTMDPLLSELEKNGLNLAPTFTFIDPFGYGGLPFHIIRRILNFNQCEVFINFAYDSINRFIEAKDPRETTFDMFFDTQEWREIREIKEPEKRTAFLTGLYTKQLKKAAQYVRAFEMINNLNKISYYLYFASNHQKGFWEMKKAMWRVDPRGSFRFADTTDVGQRFLMSYDSEQKFKEQANLIFEKYSGKTVSFENLEQFIVDSTGYPYLWKAGLRILEKEGKITVQNRQKRMTYPPGCIISFCD